MLDRLVADGLDQEDLARARRADQQHILGFADEAAGGQVEDLRSFDRRIEGEVEFVERLQFAELGRLHAAVDLPLLADEQFVLQDQFQELGVAELVAGRFLQADVERLGQARQAQLAQGGLQTIIHRIAPGEARKGELRWSCPVKRSRALQRCNPARDIQTWAEDKSAEPVRRRLRCGLFWCSAPFAFVQSCLSKPSPTEGRSCLAMDRPRDDGGVIVQRPNDRMLVQERQRLLLGRLALQQLANRPQPEAAVRKGGFAGFFQGFAGVLLGQRQQSLQHARPFDAAGVQHRLGPLLRLRRRSR